MIAVAFLCGGGIVLWHVGRAGRSSTRAELPPATARQISAARRASRLRLVPRDDINKEYR